MARSVRKTIYEYSLGILSFIFLSGIELRAAFFCAGGNSFLAVSDRGLTSMVVKPFTPGL
jgi:hypothetical protein